MLNTELMLIFYFDKCYYFGFDKEQWQIYLSNFYPKEAEQKLYGNSLLSVQLFRKPKIISMKSFKTTELTNFSKVIFVNENIL